MKTYFLLSLIPYLIYVIFKAKKYMHMLQQNWYNDGDRYFKWIINNATKTFIFLDLAFLIVFFLKGKYSILFFVILYIICFYLLKNRVSHEQSKKPLVFTPRIKRLYTTMLILYFVVVGSYIFYYDDSMLSKYYLFLGLLAYINPYIVLVANVINKPIEKLVFLHYKRLATKKINSMNNLKRIAVTGSYGKTSTKNALNDILNVKYNSFATPKSFNTLYGIINAINNYMDKFSEIFVAEMGAFYRGEIKEKCDFFKPKYGILTTIGTAHLESFGSQENIQKAKFELIDSLPSDGIAILNMDDPYQTSYKIKSKCKQVWVSIGNKKADVCASDLKLSCDGTKFTCTFKDKKACEFETKLLGNKNVYNILQSIALCYEFGMPLEQIQMGVKRIKPVEHRLEIKKYGEIYIIDDAYNSNPSGSKMALEVLDLMPGKKIIVTPGMIELGEKQYELNMEFGRQIAKVCDEVILVGEEQTKPIMDGLLKEKYNKDNIYVINDVKDAFPLMRRLSGKTTYALLENDLPDIFNE